MKRYDVLATEALRNIVTAPVRSVVVAVVSLVLGALTVLATGMEVLDIQAADARQHDRGRDAIWVTGAVSGGNGRRDVAIAVDGVVRAVSNTFELANRDGELIAALIPPSSLRRGANRIDVYEVRADGSLARMGGT